MNNDFLKSINFRNGIVLYNDFDIHSHVSFSEQKYSFKEQLLLVGYGDYTIDVGWHPEFSIDGKFIIKLVHNFNWQKIVHEIEVKDLITLGKRLQDMIDYCKKLTSNNVLIDIDIKYSPAQFGKELKVKIQQQEPVEKIGQWAYSTYLNHIEDIESDFRAFLLILGKMELGPGFTFSYEQLNQIADELIAGKNVKL